jgi:hypothetical protein
MSADKNIQSDNLKDFLHEGLGDLKSLTRLFDATAKKCWRIQFSTSLEQT